MGKIANVLKTLHGFQSTKVDGTYEYQTHEAVDYPSGYQVSFVRPEAFEQLNDRDWDILTSFYCDYLQSKAHIGVYDGAAEISFHSLELSKAEEVMKEFNQESLLDWEKKMQYPQDSTRWLVMNRNFDENELVNYHEILKRIQSDNGEV